MLAFIGRPLYFLEMVLGQFSSSGSVKIWDCVPIAKGNHVESFWQSEGCAPIFFTLLLIGIGYGQALATWCVVTYYCVLMALAFFYLFASFQAVLPWTYCDPEWATESCYSSTANLTGLNVTGNASSAEEYF